LIGGGGSAHHGSAGTEAFLSLEENAEPVSTNAMRRGGAAYFSLIFAPERLSRLLPVV
jgi:hypothetical protein